MARLRNLDTALVRTFVTAAEKGSMTAAANALHLTQGAVSQHVKRLEDLLGCTLFERERRGLKLSQPGERLLGKCRRLLELNDEIIAETVPAAGQTTVRLGVPYDLVGTLLSPALKAFAEAYPRADIMLTCAASPDLRAALAAGRLDLAVIEEPAHAAQGECLVIERLVWVGARMGSAFLKRPLPVSLVADTCAFRPAVLSALAEQGLDWRVVFENGNIDATRAMVRLDLAVTAWLASTVPADLDILPADCGLPALPGFAICLHGPDKAAAGAVGAMADFIRQGFSPRRRAA
jgi:DNA-binding transcriptional LysR family regulator